MRDTHTVSWAPFCFSVSHWRSTWYKMVYSSFSLHIISPPTPVRLRATGWRSATKPRREWTTEPISSSSPRACPARSPLSATGTATCPPPAASTSRIHLSCQPWLRMWPPLWPSRVCEQLISGFLHLRHRHPWTPDCPDPQTFLRPSSASEHPKTHHLTLRVETGVRSYCAILPHIYFKSRYVLLFIYFCWPLSFWMTLHRIVQSVHWS